MRGAVLYGDVRDGPWYCELMTQGRDVGALRDTLLFGATSVKLTSSDATQHDLSLLRRGLWRLAHGRRRMTRHGHQVGGDPDSPRQPRQAVLQRLGARRDLRSATAACSIPQIRGERTSWDAALDHVAQGFRRIIDRARTGARSRFYVSGQLLTEDYYVANKLMKGYIGTANIDTNSRLCMSSAVAGHKRAFGEDLVPVCYDDLELADLIVLVGSNTAWCHPVLFQRIVQAKPANGPSMKIVVIDPRRTATCELADLHLPVRAGTDVWLFNGLLAFLHQHGVRRRRLRRAAHQWSRRVHCRSRRTRPATCEAVADSVRHRRARACTSSIGCSRAPSRPSPHFSQGVNQSSAGTDKVNSIINCHLLTGRIGRPGMGPFSVTGQPNAMGGREVGGLANMLAAHMDLDDREPSRSRAGVLEQPAHRRARRPEGGRPVRRHPRRPHQSGVDHGDQSGGQPAGRRQSRASAATLRTGGGVRLRRSTPTRTRSRTCCCPPRAGARRTAPSPIPSDASRDSARSCRRPARREPDWWIDLPGRTTPGLRARPSASNRRTRSSPSTPRFRRSQTTVSAPSTSAVSQHH